MSTTPHSIGQDQTLHAATLLMDKYKIRHLPVLDAGKVVGLISDRDIKFALSFNDVSLEKMKVADIAKEEVYVVSPFSKLDEVVAYMASRKLGSAIVMDNGKLVGIFTAVDALGALSEILHERQHTGCSSHSC